MALKGVKTMRDMQWYVYTEDFNRKRIAKRNIFDHYEFNEGVKRIYKKNKHDFDAFAELVRKELAYYFRSKCEWETVVTSFPERAEFKAEKIDVYEQVMLNWDVFIKYVWEQAHARKTVSSC